MVGKVFLSNLENTKSIRKDRVETLVYYKSLDRETQEENWLVYARVIKSSSGFLFGKFDTKKEAKEHYQKVLRELNK